MTYSYSDLDSRRNRLSSRAGTKLIPGNERLSEFHLLNAMRNVGIRTNFYVHLYKQIIVNMRQSLTFNKSISILSLTLLLFACDKEKGPGIMGSVADKSLDGKEIYLFQYIDFETVSSDTALIKGDRFSFSGSDISEGVYYLLMDDPSVSGEIAQGLPVYLGEKKATVLIHKDQVTIGGNPENEALQKMMQELKDRNNPETEKEIIINYLCDNITNPLGEEVFLTNIQNFSLEEVEILLSEANEYLRFDPQVVEALNQK